MIGYALTGWGSQMAGIGAADEVLAIQRGDQNAFASIITRYQYRVFRYLLRLAHDRPTAEDLFQQTWLKVLDRIGRYDPTHSFEAWLFTVARNTAIDHLRRRRLWSLDDTQEDRAAEISRLAVDAPGPLEQAVTSERAALVQRALEAQPPMYREILSLRYEEELKLEEIAEVLAVPLSTVKSRLGRALERLRRELRDTQSEGGVS